MKTIALAIMLSFSAGAHANLSEIFWFPEDSRGGFADFSDEYGMVYNSAISMECESDYTQIYDDCLGIIETDKAYYIGGARDDRNIIDFAEHPLEFEVDGKPVQVNYFWTNGSTVIMKEENPDFVIKGKTLVIKSTLGDGRFTL